uniref:magnesium transporter n=1 Tax=Roseivirga sp. TaxID=1964215 RepID=UPI004048B236
MSEIVKEFELSKEYLQALETAIEEKNDAFIRETMDGVNPADISALLDEVDHDFAKYVIDILDNEVGAEIIEDLEEDTRTKFLGNFSPKEVADYITEMDSDDAVDIINDLPPKTREEVISEITDPETAAHIQELMRYDEDCAGGLMAKEMIVANVNWNIVQTIEEIRRQRENVEKIYSVYVVDDKRRLLGKVSVKDILLANDNTLIKDIFDDDVIAVETYLDEEEVATIMQKYDLDVVPVVNLQGRLVGRITIDDIVDVITDQAEEDRQLMSGLSSDVEEDDSIWAILKARLPWLIIGLIGGIVGAFVIKGFEEDMENMVGLALFIPLIMATGGNVGIQSSTLVVQSLANKSVFTDTLVKRLLKMVAVAMCTGLVLGGISFLFVNLYAEAYLGVVVAVALQAVVLLASFMGTVTPLVLDKIGINPALASGPFITTANDILGITVYLLIANLLI